MCRDLQQSLTTYELALQKQYSDPSNSGYLYMQSQCLEQFLGIF